MKICIYGAGAVGAVTGALLADAGEDVTLIARGQHLAAMKADGVRLKMGGDEKVARPACTDDPAEAGPQDFVIVASKTYSLPEIARGMAPLLGPDTAVVMVQNGIPWWYFLREGGKFEGTRLKSVDPDGVCEQHIGVERTIGGVIYGAAAIVEPGVINCASHRRITLGEPDGTISERCQRISAALTAAGMDAPILDNIRVDVWNKLFSNVTSGPICALTGVTLQPVATDPGARALVRRLTSEAWQVAEALGIKFPNTLDERLSVQTAPGASRPSMLQDVLAGKPMEIDSMIGSVSEIGRMVGLPTPFIDTMYALTHLLAVERGCYPDNPAFSLDY